MRDVRCGNVLGAAIAELRCVDASEKVFPGTEKDRRDGEMHLVDQASAKVLANRGDSAAKPDVLTVGGLGGSLKCRVDAIGHEMEVQGTKDVARNGSSLRIAAEGNPAKRPPSLIQPSRPKRLLRRSRQRRRTLRARSRMADMLDEDEHYV